MLGAFYFHVFLGPCGQFHLGTQGHPHPCVIYQWAKVVQCAHGEVNTIYYASIGSLLKSALDKNSYFKEMQ